MKHKILSCIALMLYLMGGIICFYPDIELFIREQRDKALITDFENTKNEDHVALRNQMEEYNLAIFRDDQSGLKDAWSYEKGAIEGWKDGIIGSIKIPKMDVEIPLYIGASKQHLIDGAAVLTQTSMPIGGVNTNCVIAAHRGGPHGASLFKEIEVLEQGDLVLIRNIWETLRYTVNSVEVIQPDQIDKVKIADGEDGITLITCHPYPYDNQRYVVYCNREGSSINPKQQEIKEYQISQKEINQEKALHTTAKWMFVLIAVYGILSRSYRDARKRRCKKERS